MAREEVIISVIIPQRNSIDTLNRLFDSIPKSDQIEIIVVDNSPAPITKEEINIDRPYELFWAEPSRFAGGARNVGLEHAHGKWLVFADADDYYTEGAFDTFMSLTGVDADVIYFGMTGVYDDTGEFSPRGDYYTKRVRDFLAGRINEYNLRLGFGSPCSKMVRRSLVEDHNIKYDEVIASNDTYFSLLVGYYARTIKAVDKIVYVATVSRGSLTRRKSYEVLHSRYLVKLRINEFLRSNGLHQYQYPVMDFFYSSFRAAPAKIFQLLSEAIQHKQNIFLGFKLSNWTKTLLKKKDVKDSKYDVK